MDKIIIGIICAVVGLLIGAIIGNTLRRKSSEAKIGSAEELAKKILNDANREAETKKREALVEARDELHRLRDEQELEFKERQKELQQSERRIIQKEESLDQKTENLERRNESLNKTMKKITDKEKRVDQIIHEQTQELERVAGMTTDEARTILLDDVRKEAVHDQANILREFEQQTREQSDVIAREIVTKTIQRYSSDYVAGSTVSVVSLPNDDMKGRIIGREGRNIRAFETETGVDLIIDDTPQAVVLSSFDPVRREKARITLEKLILDGRIHPTRIEELYANAEEEVNASIKEAGELALEKVGIRSMHPEMVKLLGKLKYRTSYGQNALEHTIEVATIAGMLATELGANVKVAKRGGLLHDIGKAIDHEIEGPHVDLGVNAAKKYKETKEVVHCIESHHNDVEPSTIEALIVQAADAISAARPGARRESMENYVKRLQDLENIVNGFDGIDQSFAIQAGREIRIMVKPEAINEDQMTILAHDISKHIEENLEYPGQIKVNLIRETRVTDYAK